MDAMSTLSRNGMVKVGRWERQTQPTRTRRTSRERSVAWIGIRIVSSTETGGEKYWATLRDTREQTDGGTGKG